MTMQIIKSEIMAFDYAAGCLRKMDKNELVPGQVLIHEGPYMNRSTAWLERIDKSGNNWKYYYIAYRYSDNDEKIYYRSFSHEIRPHSKVFGIGTYYDDSKAPEIISPEELAEIVRKCDEEEARQRAIQAAEQAERQAATERGKAIWANAEKQLGFKPAAVIVAELRQDTSDCMSDYYGSRSIKCVILAFSKHNRCIFSEMRKAAAKSAIPDIRALASAPENWEHRENYSGGGGYYLGEYRHGGWQIRKTTWLDGLMVDAGRDNGFEVLN